MPRPRLPSVAALGFTGQNCDPAPRRPGSGELRFCPQFIVVSLLFYRRDAEARPSAIFPTI
ncbi:hypothetical protein TIFTF001_012329 [Ficus carica]|uniref:Uncharacterized protein n=1 Tax=Ficus carica TaxID=3494 RepID=A0AA88D3L5_FICCA|nr:hypothetical protein TIFTF001_012329 [Ficus carica]